MNLRVFVYVVLLISSILACTNTNDPSQRAVKLIDKEVDEDAVRKAVESFWTAFEAKDLDALISLFTDDAVLMIPGHPAIEGVDGIREHYTPAFSGDWEWNLKMTPDIRKVIITGDWAICHIHYTGVSKDGDKEITADSKALGIYRRQPNGKWKLAYDIFNRDSSARQD